MTISYYIYFQLLSLLLAIYCYKGLKSFKLLGFIPLLVVVCVTEIIAINTSFFGWDNNNLQIYNLYVIVSTPITIYIFLRMLGYKGLKKSLYISMGVLLFIFTVLNFLFVQGKYNFDTYSLILVEFITAMLALLVIARLFKEDDSDILLNHHPYFWISAATLIFSAVTLIVCGLQQFFLLKKIQIGGVQIYRVIMPAINVFLYSCYSYAFYLCRKLTSKSLPQ
ncbi:hypothetical protein ACFGVR_06335 [Mucilaginibacter sp. AW1-3]